jgi:adenosylmethionine-8-amino-7-oxononanoate aminotransferase
VIIEPLVQGAAGLIVHPEGFLKGVEELTRRCGVLLIADEVATGFGRTGTMFACEQEQVVPDLMCLGKGITGGYLPVAATLASTEVFDAFLQEPWRETTFYHGHTYTGNPLGCAAAVACLEVFEREQTLAKLEGKIARLSEFLAEIAALEYVGDTRHKGMMAGIELVANKATKTPFATARRTGARLCQAMRAKGVLLRPLGDVVVIMPPLSISEEQLEELLGAVGETLREELPPLAVATTLGTATGGP